MNAQVMSHATASTSAPLRRERVVATRNPSRSAGLRPHFLRRGAVIPGALAGEQKDAAGDLVDQIFSSADFYESEDEDFYDIWRDSPLRFLGYANECGEAFAAWLPPGGVPLSYAIAIAYVLTDTYDKRSRAHDTAHTHLRAAGHDPDHRTHGHRPRRLAHILANERGFDCVVWQLLASVAIPGATIHVLVALVTAALGLALPHDPLAVPGLLDAAAAAGVSPEEALDLGARSIPTAAGLAAIPFIVHPIDNGVHAVLNHSLRPTARALVCRLGGGAAAGLPICEPERMVEDFPVMGGVGPLGRWLHHETLDSFLSTWSDEEPWDIPPEYTPSPQPLSSYDAPEDAAPGGGPRVYASIVEDAPQAPRECSLQDLEACGLEDETCGVLCQYRLARDYGRHPVRPMGPAVMWALACGAPLAWVLLASHFAANPPL